MMKLIPRILALSLLFVALSISGGSAADADPIRSPHQQEAFEHIRRKLKTSKNSGSCLSAGFRCGQCSPHSPIDCDARCCSGKADCRPGRDPAKDCCKCA